MSEDRTTPAVWRGEDGWRSAEDWLVDRAARLGWWEATRWAAGHERARPRVGAMAIQAYATQAAGEARRDYLEAAWDRLAQRASRALWSDPELAPPSGIEPTTISEVETATIGVLADALTAVVLFDELDRGVLPRRRTDQLLQAVTRTGLTGFEIRDRDGGDDTDSGNAHGDAEKQARDGSNPDPDGNMPG